MREFGLLSRAMSEWKAKRNEEFWVADAEALGYDNTVWPFYILASGVCFGMLLAAMEKIKRRKKRRECDMLIASE